MQAITRHAGDLTIDTPAAAKTYAALTSVGGYLDIHADAQLPALTSVGGVAATQPPLCMTSLWTVCILDQHMRVGCQTHSLYQWEQFTHREIAAMDGRNAIKWWTENKADLLGRARAAGRSFEPAIETLRR